MYNKTRRADGGARQCTENTGRMLLTGAIWNLYAAVKTGARRVA